MKKTLLMLAGIASCFSNPLATVKVNEPGEWRSFRNGELVASPFTGTGPERFWSDIPASLSQLNHYYLTPDTQKDGADDYGKLDFEILNDGPVWMLTTDSFGDYGSGSDWRTELTSRAELHTQGWSSSVSFGDWILFQRQCTNGESFSIRTEKYQSPILLQGAPIPLNDNFSNRSLLLGETASAITANEHATIEIGEPLHAGLRGGKSLWWTWVAPANGKATITTDGSTADTLLSVYTGETLASLAPIVSNDDDPKGGTKSSVTFPVQAGANYHIAVDTFGGASGEIHVNLSAEIWRLRISRSGQNIVLAWPTNSVGIFSVQASGRLGSNAWATSIRPVVVVGRDYSLKIPIESDPRKFFRLSQ